MSEYLQNKIRSLRLDRAWKLSDLAKRLDISSGAMSKIETGITDANLSRLEAIATAFDLTLVELFGGERCEQVSIEDILTQNQKLETVNLKLIQLQSDYISLLEEACKQVK